MKRNVGAAGAVAAGTITMATLVLPGVASASEPSTATIGLAQGSSATTVYPGANSQPAGSLSVTISNNNFASGDEIVLDLEPNGAANNGATNAAVSFSALPTLGVAGPTASGGGTGSTTDTTPSLSASLATDPADSNAVKNAAVTDELVIKFNNSFTGTTTDTFTINITGVQYNVGSAAPASVSGTHVDVAASYVSGSTTNALTGSPVVNADIVNYKIADTPQGVAMGSTGVALNSLTVTEQSPGVLTAGAYNVAQVEAPNSYSSSLGAFTGSATITASGLTVAAENTSGNCSGVTGSSSVTVPVNSTSGDYPFCVVTPSSSAPGSLVVSGMTYNAPSEPGNDESSIDVELQGPPGDFATNQPDITNVHAPRIAGYSADDTAAAAAESTYLSSSGTQYQIHEGKGGAVIMASDATYQDALSASFLGHAKLPSQVINSASQWNCNSYYYSGCDSSYSVTANPIVLNPVEPPASGEANTAAARAIRTLGASTVYVVGGTAVISNDVVNQLEQMQIGTVNGQPQYLKVIRIAGVTAEETAADIAQYPTIGNADQLAATPGAYGLYNSGASESSAPTAAAASGRPRTAVLANADEFQDALAVSSLAYGDELPVLLTSSSGLDPNAAAALQNLGIQQVIVVGGTAVIPDSIVSGLEAAGYSVLRVAGTTFDATSTELANFELDHYTSTKGGPSNTYQVDGLDSSTSAYSPGANESNIADLDDYITVGTSRGDSYQDALASAQVLGVWNGSGIESNPYQAVIPLLLNSSTGTAGPAVASFLSANGTRPNGGFTLYDSSGNSSTDSVVADVVFGGTLAQTPALVQSELNDIANG